LCRRRRLKDRATHGAVQPDQLLGPKTTGMAV
jgi:hypothetical protein